jgi:predicted nucleic acid-binding protein
VSRGALPALALDTGPWILWIEQNPAFLPVVGPIFREIEEGRATAVTSVIAVLEVLTGAKRREDEVLVRRYESLFTESAGVVVLDVDMEIARRAAELRARYGVRTADAIHLATALAAGASAFVTTDRRLARVKEIEVRVLKAASKGSKR